MKHIDHIYINGQFVRPHGTEILELINPANGVAIAQVTLGDASDAQAAIAAAKAAYPAFSQTTKEQRMAYLQRLHEVVLARSDELLATMIEEYGGPLMMCKATVQRAANGFLRTGEMLKKFDFVRYAGTAKIIMEPLGVVGLITPWNANYSFICGKLATALAAGSTAVIKPSELSAGQTQLLTECLHQAGLPPGVCNIVNGRGDTVGAEITRHPDIAKISNGQACLAGTRLIVPEQRLEQVKRLVVQAAAAIKVGDPRDSTTSIGPLVTRKQYDRVQRYIRLGIEQGAQLLIGGEGHPAGLEQGNFARLTVFANVTNDMAIAQEEIFGPVLSILTYKTEAEAIQIANDTVYGLHAFVSSSDTERANRVASQIVAGRVFINGLYDEPEAPFGGFKQSGIGREFGTYGLEAYLEPKAVLGYAP